MPLCGVTAGGKEEEGGLFIIPTLQNAALKVNTLVYFLPPKLPRGRRHRAPY